VKNGGTLRRPFFGKPDDVQSGRRIAFQRAVIVTSLHDARPGTIVSLKPGGVQDTDRGGTGDVS
jgi:hypothetical protein